MDRRQDIRFCAVVENYLASEAFRMQLQARLIADLARRELLDARRNPWAHKSISSICSNDVKSLSGKSTGGPHLISQEWRSV